MTKYAVACETDKTILDRPLAWYVIDVEARRRGAPWNEFVVEQYPIRPLNGGQFPYLTWYEADEAERLALARAEELNSAA